MKLRLNIILSPPLRTCPVGPAKFALCNGHLRRGGDSNTLCRNANYNAKLKHYTSRVAILCAFIYKTISDKNKKRGGIILLLRPYCNPALKPHLALKT